MEQRFAFGFGEVRIHADPMADRSATILQSSAFTLGNHIVFASGRYEPQTTRGRSLLAHELTHVVQQHHVSTPAGILRVGDAGSAAEEEADSWADHVNDNRDTLPIAPTQPSLRLPASTVQRSPVGVEKGKAGFGREPVSRSIRVTIVGHASPRWSGASSNKEADRLNEELAGKRSQVVQSAVTKLLRMRFGQHIPIEFDKSRSEDEPPPFIDVGASGAGSRTTLEEAGGNRDSNEEYSRRVDVILELFTSKSKEVGRSVKLPPMLADTKSWYVTIRRLLITGIGIPGPAGGWVELVLKNSRSGKQMLFRTSLFGGGDPLPSDTPDENVGRSEASIETDETMGFDEFKGEAVRIEKMDLQLGVGVSRYYVSFPNLGDHARNYMGQEFGLGMPGGYVVFGDLEPVGKSPGDFYEDRSETEISMTQVKNKAVEELVLTFPTQSGELSNSERERLEQFVALWVQLPP